MAEPGEILTMVSDDDEEELNFLRGDVDSSSDSEDSGSLMISQDMRPDFLATATPEQSEDDLSRLNLQVSFLVCSLVYQPATLGAAPGSQTREPGFKPWSWRAFSESVRSLF